MIQNNIGIYRIFCKSTNQSYIGSSVNIYNRKHDHFSKLKHNKHENQQLQKDYNIYGRINFNFEILEYINDTAYLLDREKYWIKYYNSSLYNVLIKFCEPLPLLSIKDTNKFWSCVNKSENCWLFSTDPNRDVPRFYYQKFRTSASRVAYKLYHPEYDGKLEVCHSCDNPRCVRPDHLFLGTHQDNMIDRVYKGRGKNCKLNKILVDKIRERCLTSTKAFGLSTELRKWLLDEYNITLSKNHINDILLNKSFIDNDYVPRYRGWRR